MDKVIDKVRSFSFSNYLAVELQPDEEQDPGKHITPAKFKKKTCIRFTKGSSADLCTCGRSNFDHPTLDVSSGNENQEQFITEDTDAYGDIYFRVHGSFTHGKFIRLSNETQPSDVWCLMKDYWKLAKPKILISVTGGAKDFSMNSKLKKYFREGLRKVVETTKAWVITGGTNAGVMKEVGNALQGISGLNYQTLLKGEKRNRVSLIGIATWGVINNKDQLQKSDHCAEFNSVHYKATRLTYPDHNHSYFLFVDDGTVGQYGKEINFRAALEKEISQRKIAKGQDEKVPAVLLIVEGGPNTVWTLAESIKDKMPAVVLKNSGRAADLIVDVLAGKYGLL